MAKKRSQVEATQSAHVDLRRVNGEETRQRILDVAQELFARHGYNGVSLRQITNRAKVNIASIHYHLGSKEHLLLEVLRRGAGPLVEKRDNALRDLQRPYVLEDIVRAFVGPVFGEPGAKQILFGELRARLVFENNKLVDRMLSELFDESTRRFVEAIGECLPDLPRKDLFFRIHYLLGVMTYTMSGPKRAKALSGGSYDPTETHETLNQLVNFVAGGFRAPPEIAKSSNRAADDSPRADADKGSSHTRRKKPSSTFRNQHDRSDGPPSKRKRGNAHNSTE
jgi:AcrR family transcriptional regulator